VISFCRGLMWFEEDDGGGGGDNPLLCVYLMCLCMILCELSITACPGCFYTLVYGNECGKMG